MTTATSPKMSTERLFELLDKMNDRDGMLHSATLWSDFSGRVETTDGLVFEFRGPEDLKTKTEHYLRAPTIGADSALVALKDLVSVIREERLMPDSLSYMKRALEVIAESEVPTERPQP